MSRVTSRAARPSRARRDVGSKTDAASVLDKLRAAVRAGTFDERGMDYHPAPSPLTFRAFAEVYKARHVVAKGLALASTIDYRLKPLLERFGDRQLAEIRTADIEDFVADLKKPGVVNAIEGRTLTRRRSTEHSDSCATGSTGRSGGSTWNEHPFAEARKS